MISSYFASMNRQYSLNGDHLNSRRFGRAVMNETLAYISDAVAEGQIGAWEYPDR